MIDWKKPKTEKFIDKHLKLVDWYYISMYQKLTEKFIEKHLDKVDWYYISINQNLSEKFIEKYKYLVNWSCISIYQKLSETFIEKHSKLVNWSCISINQNLSEKFIEKHKDLVNWYYISMYQKLTEKFIEKHLDLVDWDYSRYQKLTKTFRKKHNLTLNRDNWLYKTVKDKIKYIRKNTKYKIIDDKYIVAYKSIRSNNYSVYNFQYKYKVGKTYESHCDCDVNNENSFGLSAWTKKEALNYYSKGKLLKVKINVKDIGAIVHSGNKIRCFKLEVLEEGMEAV